MHATCLCVTAFGLTSSASARYVPLLAFHALPICPAIEPCRDVGCGRGFVPRASCDTISRSRVRYTRELHLYYTWKVHLHRLLDRRPNIYVQPNRQRRVSMHQFYPSDERVSVFPAPRCSCASRTSG